MKDSGKVKTYTVVGIVLGTIASIAVRHFFFSDYTLRSEKGGFTATYPAEPEKKQKSLDVAGMNLTLTRHVYDSENILLQVGYSDYPDRVINTSSPKALLSGAMHGGVSQMGAKVVKKKESTLRGNPGLKAKLSVPSSSLNNRGEGEGYAHVYLAGNRLYQVLAIRLKGASSDRALKSFLNSFTIWKE